MGQINDDEAAVVRDLALETNTPSSWVLSYVGVVDTNIDLAVVVVNESIILSVALAEVFGISMRGGIRSLRNSSATFLQPTVSRAHTAMKLNMLKKLFVS